ncbi:MAG: hypothetical protein JXP34_01620 [Planctomycetes bacterium]|nr:hypothetical protein [Planctomycetota bacterium]
MRFAPFAIAATIAQAVPAAAAEVPSVEVAFARASASADTAGYSLSKVQRWLHEIALQRIDPATGLYIADGRWNYRDTAADCYPFLTWAAFVVDEEALRGPVRAILEAERKLCNHLDRIPVPYDLAKKTQVDLPHDQLVFEASEYVKDGLIAIVEATGKGPWFERMKEIEEDLWKHARIETPFGKIVSENIEVNGEQIQALARLFGMTGERRFLEWAERLADHYLARDDFVPSRLRDHGCEIIGGLGLLLGVESEANPEKAKAYAPKIRRMLDEILARGLNPDGLMLNTIAKEPGRHEGSLSDGWGYNYVAYLCYDMVCAGMGIGEARYRAAIEEPLRNLSKPLYKDYRWEGDNIDGYADSIEGAIYVLNRVPVAEGFAWVDRETAAHVARSADPLDTAPLWGTMKLESNGVRTVILHALMHTRGIIARPWRRGLAIGACESADGLAIVARAKEDWSGRLVFDVPRHRLYMGFRRDWPRMNTMPEWFTVQPDARYAVRAVRGDLPQKEWSGADLARGLPLSLRAGEEVRIICSAGSAR